MEMLIADAPSVGIWDILILAILQGVAEFLPISSSGHIVVASGILDQEFDVTEVNIVLHAGTLLSILVYYYRDVIQLFTKNLRLIPKIVVATIPAVLIGLTVKLQFPELLNDPLLAGFMFVVTGFLLIALAKLDEQDEKANAKLAKQDQQKSSEPEATEQSPKRPTHYTEIGWRQALVIGMFQAVAILPGISRSGSTIVAGCMVGLTRQSAATFSFLLAIPVILGATVLEVVKMVKSGGASSNFGFLILGLIVSFGVGLLSLSLLVRWLGQGRLHMFAYYVIPLGFAVIVWQLLLELGIFQTAP